MKALDSLFTEDQVMEVSKKILDSTIEKLRKELFDSFYDEVSNYLYEHYDNASRDIQRDLIKKISGKFVNNPDSGFFLELRKKLFKENKEEIISSLTDEAIKEGISKIILKHSSSEMMFDWKWKEGIADFILNNWNIFKDEQRIESRLLREVESLKRKNLNLQKSINDLLTTEI